MVVSIESWSRMRDSGSIKFLELTEVSIPRHSLLDMEDIKTEAAQSQDDMPVDQEAVDQEPQVKQEPLVKEEPLEKEEPLKQEPLIKEKSRSSTPNPVKRQKTSEEPDIARESNEPMHEIVGGSSIRQYLNKHLTEHILEGLRQVGKEKPSDPLRVLGEFLIERSKEIEQ